MPKLPQRKSAAGAAGGGAAPREVQWPDRSVDWQVRPGQTEPAAVATMAAATRPAEPPRPSGSAGPSSAGTATRAAGRPVGVGANRPGRVASLVGFLVLVVALFGVAGISLAALGRFPMGPHAVATLYPAPDTQAPAATSTDVLGTFRPLTTPGVDGKTPRGTTGSDGRRGGGGTGGGIGGGHAGGTPDPGETESTGGAGFGSSPKPTASVAPTPTPTPDPTPTPTPDPTPTPTPDPTPTPTPDPTPTPTPDPPTPDPS